MKNISILVFVLILGNTLCDNTMIRSGLSDAQRQLILDTHNQYRQKIASGSEVDQPSASNMKVMNWDKDLEKTAQDWANGMVYSHSNKGGMGENIAASWSTAETEYKPAVPVDKWYSEVKGWSESLVDSFPRHPKKAIGHYTQIVWAETNLVGCGYSYYQEGNNKKHFTVCNYKKQGNFIGEKVYIKGEKCSQCGTDKCNTKYDALCGTLNDATEISIDQQEKSIDQQEKSIDQQEISIKKQEISIDQQNKNSSYSYILLFNSILTLFVLII